MVEDSARGLHLQLGKVVTTSATVRLGEPGAGERRLVRRADLSPQPGRFLEVLLRSAGVTFSEPHPSVGQGGAPDERLAGEPIGDPPQFLGRRSGPARLPGRDLDLDLRLEQRGTTELGVRGQLLRGDLHRILEGLSDGGQGRRQVPLGEPHEGEGGLGVPPCRGEQRAAPAQRLRGPRSADGSVRARSTASRAPDADRAAAPRRR